MNAPLALEARGLVKTYGSVTAINGADFELRPGEVLAVIGDNGAGKSSLIKALAGAVIPDSGEILMNGSPVSFKNTRDARAAGIETVYQDLAVIPALDIASNVYLGREIKRKGISGSLFRRLDMPRMREESSKHLQDLKIGIKSVNQAVETLSGGQRQGVAVARAAAFGRGVIIMDEPTAALGVRESGMVIDLIRTIRDRGIPVVLISHDMPHVFEVADRIHIHRLGKRAGVVNPKNRTMSEVVALMTGAEEPTDDERAGR
ncbi:ATP-binding cassette domain-containing protein [Rhodococcus sp. IEGM 1401]|uniref:ATP-binding cassette domain-containing protein n=1 Tax=Rhodococcus cercidiphylli TaxID=489916 RepID=A0ABU4AWU9_9NOCA|nr:MULTISPECIES: ATP-binding cassette domain-containing protein [Rhodococcus]MCZ4562557.1 ATP-binding cassette domain-containing protein [Rhodococcus sp. IEGM 1401]MDI6628092.1 ATP-binding cassette domain-containing protein [Rhodococcus sp. (in: high G+C Gram-positive bacteria)]MDI9922528.1 ATP-binding cassette domain-containing protein [Rhodococcus sp. IEGM 1372]MDV6230709.1 ATP-binding cassette domain-containing protein [Rhodococcus cercidiphylli]MDV7988998.1 ATP-binding cassette domain-cont